MNAWSKQFKLIYEDYNPNEPRVEKGGEGGGRWTDDANSIFNNQELKVAEEKMSRIMPTNFLPGYGSEEWEKNRIFIINGEKVVGYDAAIEKFEKEAEDYAGERVKKDRQAFIILGPPGAGKSTWKSKICKIYGTSCPDVDDIKKAIPEYDNGIGANAVHEESTDIGALVARNQLDKGNNIVLEKIGSNKATVNVLINLLRERHYDVHLVDIDVPIEVAMERMLKRFHETGRFVPLGYMKKVDHRPFKTFTYLRTIRGIDSYVKIDKKNHLEGKGEIYKALSTQVGWRGNFREEVGESLTEELKTNLSLRKFRVHREDVEFEKKHPRVSGGPKGGEFTKKHLKDDIWAEGDFIYHMNTGYPLKIINKDSKLYAQDKAGKVYSIDTVWDHYSKVPPENPSSIYKFMSLTDWPDEKKESKNKFKVGDIVKTKINTTHTYEVVGIKSSDKFDIKALFSEPSAAVKKGEVFPDIYTKNYELAEFGIPLKSKFAKITYDNAAKLAKEYPSKNKFKAGDTVAYTPPLGAPEIPLTKGKTYTIKGVDNVAGVIHLDNEWMLPSSYVTLTQDKDLTKEEKPEFKVGDIIQSDTSKYKYKITKIENGMAYGFLLDGSGKPTPGESETGFAKIDYLQSGDYKVVSPLDDVTMLGKGRGYSTLPKKFKVIHADRPDIPQVFNVGDKVSFRGKMYFVKYVNPKDKMVQIELAKIRHGKVLGVVTGAIVNVKPDTIFPWGSKPNNKAIQVGGDEWNQKTAVRLEYDYAKVKPLLEKIAAIAVGGKTKVMVKKTSWDDLDSDTQEKIENGWKKENYDKELEYQENEYYENDAINDAKSQVADDLNNKGSGDMPMWYNHALDEYINDRKEDKLPEIPYTKKQLFLAMQIDEDAEVKFDEDKLNEPKGYSKDQLSFHGIEKKEPWEYLTAEMRIGFSKAILDAFNSEAESKLMNMEPPDYLKQDAQESIDDQWDQMSDSEKYNWGKENDLIPEEEETSEDELDQLPTKFDPLNETTGMDYQRTQKLAKLMSVERAAQLLVERGLMNDIDTARSQIKEIDERLWQSWKDSSTTENGMILQVAAADELGGRLHEYDGLDKHQSIKDANRKFKDIGGFDGVKAYLRGKWETTQYLLDKAGIQTMKVYRNIEWDVPFMGSRTQKLEDGYIRFPNAVISRNGCQSCTTDLGVANRWGGNIVFRASAPRTAALSIPAYGINVHTEHECVLAGTAWQAYDVWNKPAPTFDNVPLTSITEKMFTSSDSPYMPKITKREMKKLNSTWPHKAKDYWQKYSSIPKPLTANDVKPGDIVYSSISLGYQMKVDKIKHGKVYGKNFNPETNWSDDESDDKPIQYYYKTKEEAEAAHDADMAGFPAYVKAMSKQLAKEPKKFKVGTKISGASGSNFADTEFTVNSVNRNGTMDVTSEYGTPYTGVKPHLFQTSTKVQGKFKVGDKLNYGTVAKYEVVKGPYKTYNNDVGYDIKDSSGEIYKNEVLPSYVTKEEPKSFTATTTIGKDKGKEFEYKVGDLVKGGVSGNIYKIDKIGDTSVHFIVQKAGNAGFGPPLTVGGSHQDTITSLGSVYKKVEPEKPKMDSTFRTSEKYQKSLDKFKVGQTVYSQYHPGKGYVITGFMKNGDLDVEEINLKNGKPTYHDAKLVSDFIFTSKEDAKKAPGSNWGKDD